jgi:hypothetical protein
MKGRSRDLTDFPVEAITGDIARASAGSSLLDLPVRAYRPLNVVHGFKPYTRMGTDVAAVTSMVLTKIAATQVETVRNSSAVIFCFLSNGAHSP